MIRWKVLGGDGRKNFSTFVRHTQKILKSTSCLRPPPPLYILTQTSLSESVSWVTDFINYIDETYNQYDGGKFGTKKSWYMTTKLAMVLIEDVGQPRIGAMNSFKAGDS